MEANDLPGVIPFEWTAFTTNINRITQNLLPNLKWS